MNSTREIKLSRIVDCGKDKYRVEIDSLGVSVIDPSCGDGYCLRFVDVPAFHAAAIADTIVTLTAEYAADVAKLKGGAA